MLCAVNHLKLIALYPNLGDRSLHEDMALGNFHINKAKLSST